MIAALALALAVAAPAGEVKEEAAWRRIATPADRDRLARWREAWIAALDKARGAGAAAAIADGGALFAFDQALDRPVPPPGEYRCRVVKLGGQRPGMLDYVAYPAFTCRIERDGEVSTFVKLTGSQRPEGRIFADRDTRAVFLGTMVLGDERTAIDYGRDRLRNVAGTVERIGPARWRMAFPYPAFESMLDVIELTPR